MAKLNRNVRLNCRISEWRSLVQDALPVGVSDVQLANRIDLI